VLDVERRIAPRFDLISVPYQAMLPKFAALTPRLAWHPHGVPTHLLDEVRPNPFAGLQGPHAVFSGVILFDVDFLCRASELFPQVQFHIIGPHEQSVPSPNVHYYGEIPYLDTIPFVTHADLGLQCTLPKGGMGSNKAMIYTYCRLPMVASLGNETRGWPHVFIYVPGDTESIAAAMRAALACDRSRVPAGEVPSWDDVARGVLGEQWDEAGGRPAGQPR
jgi:2-beta-glucuronyltransferase